LGLRRARCELGFKTSDTEEWERMVDGLKWISGWT
jgi:hypothetical protein